MNGSCPIGRQWWAIFHLITSLDAREWLNQAVDAWAVINLFAEDISPEGPESHDSDSDETTSEDKSQSGESEGGLPSPPTHPFWWGSRFTYQPDQYYLCACWALRKRGKWWVPNEACLWRVYWVYKTTLYGYMHESTVESSVRVHMVYQVHIKSTRCRDPLEIQLKCCKVYTYGSKYISHLWIRTKLGLCP